MTALTAVRPRRSPTTRTAGRRPGAPPARRAEAWRRERSERSWWYSELLLHTRIDQLMPVSVGVCGGLLGRCCGRRHR